MFLFIMEITFTEHNYWDKAPIENDNEDSSSYQEPTTKRKKVVFNDILTNMNLVVNKHGVLQSMASQPQSPKNASIHQQPPLEKNSYIYNKYFKHYEDNQQVYEPRVPKTKEEYIQMLLEERQKKQELQKHLAQVKPKKLLLTGSTQGIPGMNIQASKNTLFKLQFR